MNFKKPEKKEILFLMFTGCIIGILCFALVYGFKIVDVTYNGWLFHGDMDLRQHYVGFCHFRNSPWHFPIGIIDTLSKPYSMSVVYTDSIPLFAVIFKLFSNVLPETFQYFGLFGLLSFSLMGALSPVLIRRLSHSRLLCLSGSLFFILSFPILHRMFYHTALSAQWIIVLALIIWLYTDITDKAQLKKICIYWGLIGLLSVSIHSYFVFMTGIVLLLQICDGIIRTHKKGTKLTKELWMALPLISMGISSFILLYVLGGFYGSGSVSGDGFGSFYANLSAYVNPLHFSTIFNGFENNGMFEFEGFSYLGAGMITMLIVLASYEAAIHIRNYHSGKNINEVDTKPDFNANNSCKLIYALIIAFIIIVLLFSCFPNYSFGSVKLISLPVPKFIKSILGICRTNARFVWVGMYLFYVIAFSLAGKHFNKIWVKLLVAFAIVLQLYEMSGIVKQYHEKYSLDEEFETVWTLLEDENVIDGKEEFVFMYDYNDIMMDTAYYAYLHKMSQNSFYYARTIYDEIDATIEEWSDEFLSGNLDSSVIYVFRNEDYTKEYDEVVKQKNANKYEIPEHIVITVDK